MSDKLLIYMVILSLLILDLIAEQVLMSGFRRPDVFGIYRDFKAVRKQKLIGILVVAIVMSIEAKL